MTLVGEGGTGDAREIARSVLARFERSGAVPIDVEILQPADLLLDLYGEDIRARAFVTRDPVRGEFVLRPDFTVPVARMYMAGEPVERRFTYRGSVWRIQRPDSERAPESIQVGYEIFGSRDRAASDAEVFGLFNELLSEDRLDVVVGDMGILLAAVAGLETSERRKAMLRRHLWRPGRFRALLDRYACVGGELDRDQGQQTDPRASRGLLAEDAVESSPVHVGLREPAEIAARHLELEEESHTPPITRQDVETIEAVLDLGGTMTDALARLERLRKFMPSLDSAVAAFAERMDALRSVSVDVDTLRFATGHGRKTMEYYDGFVFSFMARHHDDWPPVASGGRYDALTGRLDHGRSVPAVGGVIRPETLAAVRAEAA